MMTLKRVFRSLARRPKYGIGFLVAGILGLSGNLYLDSLQGSIRSSLGSKSRELLTADVSISVRRLTNESERKQLDDFLKGPALEVSRSIDLYSMVSDARGSRLVQLIAIEPNYPLVGKITLEKYGVIESKTPKQGLGAGEIWIDPDLRESFGFKKGGLVRIGEKDFHVGDVVLDDTANAWRGFTLAPRIFMNMDDLWKSGLIRKGSTLWDRTYSVLKPGVQPRVVAKAWNSLSEDSAIRATPHEEASEQVAKLTGYLNDYLGLIGITTLFLALVGISFLFQTELRGRLRMIGTLRALGDSTHRIGLEIALEALVLGLLSAVASIILVFATLPMAARLVSRLSGVPVFPVVAPSSALLTLALGAFVGFFIALPFASRVARLKPSALFQDEVHLALPSDRKDQLLFLPLAALFFTLSVYHSHSLRVGSLFFVLAVLSVGGLLGMGRFIFSRLEKLKIKDLSRRLAMRSLARNPWSSLSGFIAVGLGALLLSLIPSLQSIISSEIERPEGSKVPSLFFFDIQEDQLSGVKSRVEAHGVKLEFISPMIRARLESLKGKPVTKALDFSQRSTREQEEEERSRNRGFNLSYREGLSDSEAITAGRSFLAPFDSTSGALPEVTLEKKFADRLGVGLGDRIGFDIQGIPVEAVIVGLRRVRWSSFQPNFFVLFQPGVLDDAPKTFLGGVPTLDPAARRELQNALVKDFPNVSIIQVDEMVKKLLLMFDQMGMAVKVTAILSLITGIFVLFSIAKRQVELRRRSALLLKTVGASGGRILAIFLWEFGTLATIASLLGVGFSLAISKLIAWIVFDRADAGLELTSFAAVGIVLVISLLAVVLASYRLVRERPWKLLQADGER